MPYILDHSFSCAPDKVQDEIPAPMHVEVVVHGPVEGPDNEVRTSVSIIADELGDIREYLVEIGETDVSDVLDKVHYWG